MIEYILIFLICFFTAFSVTALCIYIMAYKLSVLMLQMLDYAEGAQKQDIINVLNSHGRSVDPIKRKVVELVINKLIKLGYCEENNSKLE